VRVKERLQCCHVGTLLSLGFDQLNLETLLHKKSLSTGENTPKNWGGNCPVGEILNEALNFQHSKTQYEPGEGKEKSQQ
jgi:hypothetical protein